MCTLFRLAKSETDTSRKRPKGFREVYEAETPHELTRAKTPMRSARRESRWVKRPETPGNVPRRLMRAERRRSRPPLRRWSGAHRHPITPIQARTVAGDASGLDGGARRSRPHRCFAACDPTGAARCACGAGGATRGAERSGPTPRRATPVPEPATSSRVDTALASADITVGRPFPGSSGGGSRAQRRVGTGSRRGTALCSSVSRLAKTRKFSRWSQRSSAGRGSRDGTATRSAVYATPVVRRTKAPPPERRAQQIDRCVPRISPAPSPRRSGAQPTARYARQVARGPP